jgi:hypothetical protein
VWQQLTIEARKLYKKNISKEVEEINNVETKSAMATIIHQVV